MFPFAEALDENLLAKMFPGQDDGKDRERRRGPERPDENCT